MVGEECTELRHMLSVNYPMENGVVKNWDDVISNWSWFSQLSKYIQMGHIYDYTFGEQKLDIHPPASLIPSSLEPFLP